MSHANNHMLDEMEAAAIEAAVNAHTRTVSHADLVAMVTDHDYASLAEVCDGDMFASIRVARIIGLHIRPGEVDDFLTSIESYVAIRRDPR